MGWPSLAERSNGKPGVILASTRKGPTHGLLLLVVFHRDHGFSAGRPRRSTDLFAYAAASRVIADPARMELTPGPRWPGGLSRSRRADSRRLPYPIPFSDA